MGQKYPEPTGLLGKDCRIVAMPDAIIDIRSTLATSSGVPPMVVTITTTSTQPDVITKTCWSPSRADAVNGGLSSTP
jgi:hypothetical protein